MIFYKKAKRFNTDTSDLLMDYTNGKVTNDFDYLSIEVYRTPRGVFWILTETYNKGSIEIVSKSEAYNLIESKNEMNEELVQKYFIDLVKDA